MQRRIALYALIAGITVYAALAVSPAPRAIARDRPELAALFRPPWFNFSAEYEDGHVLDFHIGASRDELLRTLTSKDSETGTIAAACGREPGARPLTVAESHVSVSSREALWIIQQRATVCLLLHDRKVLIFDIENEHVRRIQLTKVTNELL